MKPAIEQFQNKIDEQDGLLQRRLRLAEAQEPAAEPVWARAAKPNSERLTSDDVRNFHCPEADLPAHLERELVEIITRPIPQTETRYDGNNQREREIIAFIAQLTPAQALELGRRIDSARATDPIVVAMQRLIGSRRNRLRDALTNHRRLVASRQCGIRVRSALRG